MIICRLKFGVFNKITAKKPFKKTNDCGFQWAVSVTYITVKLNVLRYNSVYYIESKVVKET